MRASDLRVERMHDEQVVRDGDRRAARVDGEGELAHDEVLEEGGAPRGTSRHTRVSRMHMSM